MLAGMLAFTVSACTSDPNKSSPPATSAPGWVWGTPPPPTTDAPDSGEGRESRPEQYQAIVKDFPYDLPPGFSFPDTLPSLSYPTVTPVNAAGDQVAFGLWRCGLVDEAASAATAGDLTAAHAWLAQAAEATDDQLPGNADWVRGMVDSTTSMITGQRTLCHTWLDKGEGNS